MPAPFEQVTVAPEILLGDKDFRADPALAHASFGWHVDPQQGLAIRSGDPSVQVAFFLSCRRAR